MWTLIRNGGVIPMMFILVFGAVSLVSAFYFAVRAQRRSLGFLKSMSQATLYATLAATAADVGATLYTVQKVYDEPAKFDNAPPVRILIEGLAESTSPAILGFPVLALTAMLTAVGRRRLDERADLG
ncbi:MAG: hypothetical protein KF819_15525 [Labilithrix sp.]|nr:hypothetical protein [Labilithrix sp.]